MNEWQQHLSSVITDPALLCKKLSIDPARVKNLSKILQQFPLRVPHHFVARMQAGNLDDPLLKQVLPWHLELEEVAGFSKDPVQESHYNKVPGLLHKYDGRVLLTIAGACAINCRYCFRRHFPYSSNITNWQPGLNYIRDNKSIKEVILSGGDPLIVKDEQLIELVAELEKIPHVQRLRIHSRLPIVIPQRVSKTLIALLASSRLQSVMVIHCNHANEINAEVAANLDKFRVAKITLLNQTVLLKGINDDETSLINLNEKLFAVGVLPYYLHLLDPVAGAAHFKISDEQALVIYRKIQAKLPGYLLPKLVREVSGATNKIQIL